MGSGGDATPCKVTREGTWTVFLTPVTKWCCRVEPACVVDCGGSEVTTVVTGPNLARGHSAGELVQKQGLTGKVWAHTGGRTSGILGMLGPVYGLTSVHPLQGRPPGGRLTRAPAGTNLTTGPFVRYPLLLLFNLASVVAPVCQQTFTAWGSRGTCLGRWLG